MAQLFHVRVLPHFGRLEDSNDVSWPWKIAGCFIPISLGWAAGDVSFAAYMIPSALAESKCFPMRMFLRLMQRPCMLIMISFPIGANTRTYIVLNAALSSVLCNVIDKDFTRNGDIMRSLITVGGLPYETEGAGMQRTWISAAG
ncbi:hypothetical protein CC1G_15265 [Coprinopsis cinerea okayama7|uniref:Uncharacterized protein n=1 Tax=Coprinopsis cinerea (strain Okayama-7 / 130 / ATCC MYA-4618 / FGSC 9003) TaxID=240176 RepID=D6RPW4_COPC7|nr:hypothetical protein CC1G_15265 [Coprinopsis cinerea okayama7\|eukprot:XP_002910357.1 hypothetical protein CC1G_15265 [Coprinopsis cinerea okayama7\